MKCKFIVGCTCEKLGHGYISHFSHANKDGQPICYVTLTKEKIEEWRKDQTAEQLKLTEWLEKTFKNRKEV